MSKIIQTNNPHPTHKTALPVCGISRENRCEAVSRLSSGGQGMAGHREGGALGLGLLPLELAT